VIVPYRQLPGSSTARPFVDVLIGRFPFRVSGLVDSGAVHGLFHPDVAIEGGIDLAGAEERPIAYGPAGASVSAKFITVPLELDGFMWDAEVGFTAVMSADWGLLGQSAFFRWFTVTFRTCDDEFEVEPNTT
jgi:hypothetical protein